MGHILRFLLVAAVIYLGYRLLRAALGGALGGRVGRPRFKCANCKNCKALFDDGVLCMFGRRETFKNETHIANCHDWERAG